MNDRETRAVQEAAYLLGLAHQVAPLACAEALTALELTGQVGLLLSDLREAKRAERRARKKAAST